MENDQLFSDRELTILREAQFDPKAVRKYGLWSGGFYWSDERIDAATDTGAYRRILTYRASLSAGSPRGELLDTWNQLRNECSAWPGFHPDRCAAALATELDEEWKRVE